MADQQCSSHALVICIDNRCALQPGHKGMHQNSSGNMKWADSHGYVPLFMRLIRRLEADDE